jgi:hypothetical protein
MLSGDLQTGCDLRTFVPPESWKRIMDRRDSVLALHEQALDADRSAQHLSHGCVGVVRVPKRGKRCTMEFRRRVPRQVAGWVGSCHIDGEPPEEWRPCRVLDVSELGLGAVIEHPLGTALVGRRIAVETPTMGVSVNVQLEGEVKNAIPLDNGSVRIGIEFGGLTELEHSLVKALGVLSDAP